jgi:hypothetical protein
MTELLVRRLRSAVLVVFALSGGVLPSFLIGCDKKEEAPKPAATATEEDEKPKKKKKKEEEEEEEEEEAKPTPSASVSASASASASTSVKKPGTGTKPATTGTDAGFGIPPIGVPPGVPTIP